MKRAAVILLTLCCMGADTALYDPINLVTEGTFARNEASCVLTPDGKTAFLANARRTRTVWMVNDSDGVARSTGEFEGASYIVPLCGNSSYLFGVDYTNSVLYRSTDGDTWVVAEESFDPQGTVLAMTASGASGRLLTVLTVGAGLVLYYGSADGGTWTKADLASNGNDVVLTDEIGWWSIAEDGSGGTVVSTYGDRTKEQSIWYSADYGLTWVKATINGGSLGVGEINHVHAVGYHATLGMWIAQTGDGIGERRLFTSTNGTAWADYNSAANIYTPYRSSLTSTGDVAQAGSGASTIKLAAGESSTDDIYVGLRIALTEGPGSGDVRTITAYDGDGGGAGALIATVDSPWTATPTTSTEYKLEDPGATGTLQAVGTSGDNVTVTLAADASAVTNDYAGCRITITNADEYSFTRFIPGGGLTSFYNGGTKVLTLDRAWDAEHTPDDSSTYVIERGFESPGDQITRFRDYGHATRILCAGDNYGRIHWLDLSTWDIGTLVNEHGFVGSNNGSAQGNINIFDVRQIGGAWYAAGENSMATTGYRRSIIAVSPDLENWVVYHQSTANNDYGFFNIAGYYSGKLHVAYVPSTVDAANTNWRHFVISPAKLAKKTGVYLAPATINLLSAAASEGATTTGLTNTSDFVEVDSTVYLSGTSSLHVREKHHDSIRVAVIGSPAGAGTFADSEYYIMRAWVKGYAGQVSVTNWGGNYARYFWISPDRWTEVYTLPIQWTTGTAKYFRLDVQPRQYDGLSELWIDCVQISAVPNRWWVPGPTVADTASVADVLSYTTDLGTDWTHVFTIKIDDQAWSNANIGTVTPLVTYKVSATDYVTLGYDGDDAKWTLTPVDDEVAGSAITSAANYYHRGGIIRFAVRCAGESLRLSVNYGGATEHVATAAVKSSAGDAEPMAGDDRVIVTGAVDGAGVLPHILLDSQLYNVALSDAIINEMLSKVTRESWMRSPIGIDPQIRWGGN